MRVWRNWQTRKIQVLIIARLCRFKSCYPHQAWGSPYSRKQKKCFWHFFCFLFFASPHAVPIVRTVRTRDARFHLAIPSLRSLQVLLRRRSKAFCFDFFCKKSRIWRFLLLFRQNAVLTNIRLRLLFLKSFRLFGLRLWRWDNDFKFKITYKIPQKSYLSENDNVVFFYLWQVLPLFVKAGFHEFF